MLKSTQGFSLIELMIGSVLGLIVVAGALQLYLTNIQATSHSVRSSRLNQELRASLDMLSRELRRSGYWAGEPMVDRPFDNPFQTHTNDLRVDRHPGEAESSCILYSYDLNADKQVGVGASGSAGAQHNRVNLEQFGLRLRNGRLQLRNGGNRFDCGSGVWQGISDADTEITRLAFQLHVQCIPLSTSVTTGAATGVADCTPGRPALLRRRVAIQLAARSRSDGGISHQLDSEVLIGNDKLLRNHP